MADALPGRPAPLGATPRDGGTNFAVTSGIAEAVELCLFDDGGAETRVRLRGYDDGVWHGFVAGIGPGQAYGYRVRGPWDVGQMDSYDLAASVNLITVHDGFTLRDLVSYDAKHNEANGESSRDGTNDNRSWNCGAEGPTPDPEVLALRARRSRAMLSTLLLPFGVPMLLGGDELGRTQGGNNNADGQDNEISWYDWSAVDDGLLSFTRNLVEFRRSHPVFRPKSTATTRSGRPAPAPSTRPATGSPSAPVRCPCCAARVLGNGRPRSPGEVTDGGRRDLQPVARGNPDPGGQLFVDHEPVPGRVDPGGGADHHHDGRRQQE